MNNTAFKHIATINIPDPDFMPIFLQPCGTYAIALQTWCAYLVDIDNATIKLVDYPAWAWNVSSMHAPKPGLTIFFERPRVLKRCPVDPETGEVGGGEIISEETILPAASPPHLVTSDAIWYPHSGKGHAFLAARHDRVTDLAGDVSRISYCDFFLSGPGGKVFIHRWDTGLLDPAPPANPDQPELVVNYQDLGCGEARGASFDENGNLWILDEVGPKLFRIDLKSGDKRIFDLADIHRSVDDLSDPSPYPWHSCLWLNGRLLIGSCDQARLDILEPVEDVF